jgi:hypothetical protein
MTIRFTSDVQAQCFERVKTWLEELYPTVSQPFASLPVLSVALGSAIATVEVMAWGESDAIITTASFVVTEAEITKDLMEYLLMQNAECQFGVFSLDDLGNIRLHSTLVGSSCDRQKLDMAVTSVLAVADYYDDQIVAVWGGQRGLDRLAGHASTS